MAGVVDHLRSNEFGNGELAEFLAAMERSSGRSLSSWSAAWLETAGADRLALEAGVLGGVRPGGEVLRHHGPVARRGSIPVINELTNILMATTSCAGPATGPAFDLVGGVESSEGGGCRKASLPPWNVAGLPLSDRHRLRRHRPGGRGAETHHGRGPAAGRQAVDARWPRHGMDQHRRRPQSGLSCLRRKTRARLTAPRD